ncbi:MFS general substrate transporter [Durotheca rogersii]|uniref:MFS general substrate transporter n=1 Tax=Durotheca rogersii TaxID=419775 RepID=UPI00221F77D8|nr:MFS general substrate transporter [Durotheca rogersii]KAI5861587.1 MFS general substrate transporter [Durotheca rogersii]
MDDNQKITPAPKDSRDDGSQKSYSVKDGELTSQELERDSFRAQPGTPDSHEDGRSSQNGVEGAGEAQGLDALSRASSAPLYSVFSPSLKWWIIALNGMIAFISPITANIYFPAIPSLARDLGVSIADINLTVTTFMVFQAIAPTFFGDFSDAAGRRPASMIALVVYLCANIGLAVQRKFIALLLLRMLQSAGSSGTLSLVYAVVADLAPSSERGRSMAVVGAGITIGPTLGPVIGGLLAQYLGWPSIFWFLCIVTVVLIIPYALTVPETGRRVVGNGSIPPQGWNMTLIDYVRLRRQARNRPASTDPRRKIRLPNPLHTLAVVAEKEMALVLFYNATLYLGFMIATVTISSQFSEIYHYSDIELGLCYLPIGSATIFSSVVNGLLADWNYRRIAKKLGVEVDRKRGENLGSFPIEKARLQLVYPLLVVGTAAYIAFGWALHKETHVAVPLVLSFFIGLCITGPFQILNMLIVDLHPEAPATATAANNLVRCLSGAVATAVIDYMIRGWGRGWAFTFFALLFSLCSPALVAIDRYGPQWREERRQKMERAAEKKEVGKREKANSGALRNGGVLTESPSTVLPLNSVNPI